MARTDRGGGGMGGEGGEGERGSGSTSLRPGKTEEAVDHRQ